MDYHVKCERCSYSAWFHGEGGGLAAYWTHHNQTGHRPILLKAIWTEIPVVGRSE
jgi:hypothetical protein